MSIFTFQFTKDSHCGFSLAPMLMSLALVGLNIWN